MINQLKSDAALVGLASARPPLVLVGCPVDATAFAGLADLSPLTTRRSPRPREHHRVSGAPLPHHAAPIVTRDHRWCR
jgi:hypothetical protein